MCCIRIILLFTIFRLFALAQTGSVEGQIRDKTNSPVPGATVTFQLPGGTPRRAHASKSGSYAFHNLEPGNYQVNVAARGFEPYEVLSVRVTGPRSIHLDFRLDLAPVKQVVVVASDEKPMSVEPVSSPSTLVLRGTGLNGLPDDPNDFAAALDALAGPSALGPTDPQIFVNGFVLNQIPPKETIAEIRINENPFSAENDRPAANKIEAVTKSGSDQVHGEGYINWDAGWWDATNPFTRPLPANPSQLEGGNVAGPITSKVSFFVSLERTRTDLKNAVNATVLNSSLVSTPLVENVADFQNSLLFSPQLNFTLNKTNTLMVRYSSSGYSLPREGVGGTALPQNGYKTSDHEQTVQLSETAALNTQSVNEAKFQYVRTDLSSKAYSSTPAIAVDQAFTSGTSPLALSSLRQNQWEFQNNFSTVLKSYAMRAGIRLRGSLSSESLEKNAEGTYSFSAGSGPALNADGSPILDPQRAPTTIPISGLERYRRTILFQQEGLTSSEIRQLGGGPSSYTLNSGDPFARVRQYDVGVYLQNDWHIRPNLLLGAGIRYEKQTNLHDNSNVGPRLSFAWAPVSAVGKDNPHTVFRGGVGLFYERLDSSLVLQSRHTQQQQLHYMTSDPSVLNLFPAVPPLTSLAPFSSPADSLQIAPNVRAPVTLQETLTWEQQLPYKTRVSISFIEARTYRDLLVVDSSPFQLGSPRFLTVESKGLLTQRQMRVELSNRFTKQLNITANYVYSGANSNTDGTSNPAASWNDLSGEFGRSEKDLRHNFTLTGSWDAPWRIRLSPFLVASSSRPFNIITGTYNDPDIPFTGRPVLVTDPTQPDVIVTQFGAFRLNPLPGEAVIARNFGRGPAFFSASFRLSKTFAFGEAPASDKTAKDGSSGKDEHRYGLVVSAQVINLTNHLNAGIPEGNLSSAQFGQASSLAPGFNFGGGTAVYHKQLEANRRMELQLRFTF